MERRGFSTNYDTRHHLEEMVRALTITAEAAP
jgi:hypothetical protein